MPGNDISSQLDSIRPLSCCSDLREPDYRPAYVGPLYGDKTKILFIGLDLGTSDDARFRSKSPSAREWGDLIFHEYRTPEKNKSRNRSWNDHYRGCVRTAAAILKTNCESECGTSCQGKPRVECTLSYFSQTNAVKCAPPKVGRAFKAHHRIRECMARNLFAEVEILQPDVIVLQGRNRNSGHIHEDFENQLASASWGSLAMDAEGLVGTIAWTRGQLSGRRAVLALFAHPSARGKFNLKNAWVREILPSIPKIHALLAAIKP
jgi:uracil-DNA glycosylase